MAVSHFNLGMKTIGLLPLKLAGNYSFPQVLLPLTIPTELFVKLIIYLFLALDIVPVPLQCLKNCLVFRKKTQFEVR